MVTSTLKEFRERLDAPREKSDMITSTLKEFRERLDAPREKSDIFNTVGKYKEQTEKKK